MQAEILPGWMRVIQGRQAYFDFLGEFASDYVDHVKLIGYEEPVYPDGYLESLNWYPPRKILASADVRNSQDHANLPSWVPELGDISLFGAIKQSAAAVLPGPDELAHSIGSHLHSRPEISVVGFQSIPYFLDVVFNYSSEECGYLHESRGTVAKRGETLLAALSLGRRTFPGISVLPKDDCWPAYDDIRMMGYITPHEVKELWLHLEHRADVFLESNTADSRLLLDRVRRSSEESFGLVTLHGGLEE